MGTMLDSTLQAIRVIRTVEDLVNRAEAISVALAAGDAVGAKEGTTRLQTFLVGKDDKFCFANENTIIEALQALGGRNFIRGRRVASYLMVHTRDTDARDFWSGVELVLEAAA